MGNVCVNNADKQESAASREIDRQLQLAKAQSDNTVKLLLLGEFTWTFVRDKNNIRRVIPHVCALGKLQQQSRFSEVVVKLLRRLFLAWPEFLRQL